MHSLSTLQRHNSGSNSPDTTLTSTRGHRIYISTAGLYCYAAFDDRAGHFFELQVSNNDDPGCAEVGPAAGQLADAIVGKQD